MDFPRLLTPTEPIEVIVRGTIMYLALFVCLRVILKRQTGHYSLADLLLTVLVADAAQNGMAGEYHSVSDGILLVLTLAFWNNVLDRLGHRFPKFGRIVHPPPLQLIENGKMLHRNMRREFITEEELLSQLRENGCEGPAEVKAAYMEGDGRISVIPMAT